MNIKDFIKHKDNNYNLEKNNLELNKETLDYLVKNNITEAYTSKPLNKLIKTLDEYTYSTYPNEILLYKGVLIKNTNLDKSEYLNIKTTSLNLNDVEKICQNLNLDSLKKMNISVNEYYNYSFIFNKDHVSIEIQDTSLDKVYEICNLLSKSYKIDNLNINFNVIDEKELIKDVNYYDFDYKYLDELSKTTNIQVNYRFLCGGYVDYDDFRKLINVVKDYRKTVNNKLLSPLEKLTVAYDLMKYYQYSESENILDTYTPDKIIKYGKITCVGYSLMMEEILKCLDENIKITSVSLHTNHNLKREGHERNLVRIDDDKYNIHGLYFLDATWDSYNDKFKKVYGEDYKVFDIYRHFLIPFSEYDKVFPRDTKPPIFSDYINSLLQDNWKEENLDKVLGNLKNEEIEILQPYKVKMFKDIKKTKDKFKYVCAKRIPFSNFLNAVVAVRQVEGYDKEDLKNEVIRASKTTSEFYEDNNYDIDEIVEKGKIM